MINLIGPPHAVQLPDIVSIKEAERLFGATNKLSYRIFYFTVYSPGLRPGERLRLEVGDLDAKRQRVHIRDAKGNFDGGRPNDSSLIDHPVILIGVSGTAPRADFTISSQGAGRHDGLPHPSKSKDAGRLLHVSSPNAGSHSYGHRN